MKAVIAGGNGFLGSEVGKALGRAGWDVVSLARRQADETSIRTVEWDAENLGPWVDELNRSDALINFCGSTIAQRWDIKGKASILNSRINSTKTLGAAIFTLDRPPPVWLNSSASGFYGHRGDEILTERSEAGGGFAAEIASVWEESQTLCQLPHTRLIQLRTGLPLSCSGGLFPVMAGLTRKFLGSALGRGTQWWPWIHIDDYCRAVIHCIENSISGPVNLCSPNPVTNNEFMHEMRNQLGKPWVPNVPKPMLYVASIFGGPPPELLLMSTRTLPEVLQAVGFAFEHPELAEALADLVPKVEPEASPQSQS